MSRHLIVGTLCLFLLGCGIGRMDMKSHGPVSMVPVPPLHQSINSGDEARDLAAARNGRNDPAALALGGPPRSRVRKAPWANPAHEGRGADPEIELAQGPRPSQTAPARTPADDGPMTEAPPSVDASVMPAAQSAGPADAPPPIPAGLPQADPSLGPRPDAVPALDLPDISSNQAPSPGPAVPENLIPESLPAQPDPSLGPHPDALPVPEITEPPAAPTIEEAPPPGFPGPLPARPGADPSLGPNPDAVPDLDGVPETTRTRPPVSHQVVRTSTSTEPASNANAPEIGFGKAASETAARVGDEIITFSELRSAVREQVQAMNVSQDKPLTAEDTNAIASITLDRMIDRAIVVQEARRKLKEKNEKVWKNVLDSIERAWKEKELPELVRQHKVADETALKKKLEALGLSLDDKHMAFTQNTLAREYIMMQVREKVRVFPHEMRSHYEAHRADFIRPAQVRWREVAIEVNKHASRAEARQAAETALAKVRRGQPFAKVAQSDSHGPTAAQGGLWETSPDGYDLPAVREALNTLPINQVSGVLEGPRSFHVVLVEDRRGEGPARFDEVQDEVRKLLLEKKEADEMNAYLDGLRGRYVVTTKFDGTKSAPGVGRRLMEEARKQGPR